MEILILGGSGLLADQLSIVARARGGRVSWVPGGPNDSERRGGGAGRGRGGELEAVLPGERRFDVWIDQRRPEPGEIERTSAAIGEGLGRYVLLTSATWPGLDPAGASAAPDWERAQAAAERAFGSRAWCLRTAGLVGAADPASPLACWLARARRGGEMLCPAPEGQGVQWLDARDLAEFLWLGLERECFGRLELGGPHPATSLGEVIRACVDLAGGAARPVWADGSWLEVEARVSPRELPLWRPDGQPSAGWRLDVRRAREAGLAHRPLAATLSDTQRELERGALAPAPGLGLDPAREARLLADWARERRSGRRSLEGAEI
jgi:2'-hydroxyisoflavone reductase